MATLREEAGSLGRLAVPIVLTHLGSMAMNTVDLLMIGRLNDARAMAGVAVAGTLIHGTVMFAIGLVMGIDPLVTQAHGARDARGQALALQRGVVVALLASALVTLVWAYNAPFLRLMGQEEATIVVASAYTRAQLFSAAPLLLYIALRQYLQGRGVVTPILVVVIVANLANILFNWIFIFGHLGFAARGAAGAGLATGAMRVFMLVGLLSVTALGRLHDGAWVPWSRAALSRRGLARVLAYGLPTAVQVSLEIWAFGAAMLMAGRLGATAAAAHITVLKLASITFMMPLGISVAACTRVGNFIGAGDRVAARRASWVALAMGAGVMALNAIVLWASGATLPGLFFGDAGAQGLEGVLPLAASIVPICATFQIFDGTQAVACGILRAQGRTLPAALINLVGYWVLALPVGWWMTFHLGLGLRGIWWGLALALALIALALLAWVGRYGPGSARST